MKEQDTGEVDALRAAVQAQDTYEVRAVWNDGEGGKVSQPFSHEKMYEKEVGRGCDHYGVYRNNDDGTQTHVVDFDDRPEAQHRATRDVPERFQMDDRQLAVVLTALRCLQTTVEELRQPENDPFGVHAVGRYDAAIEEIAGGRVELAEIDALCEWLNMGQEIDTRRTVILMHPDYIAQDYGHEVYTAWTTAKTWEKAVADARRQAVEAQEPDTVNDPEDFALIGYVPGHVTLEAPES